MNDGDWLRARLERIIEATPEVDVTVGFWVGDKAGERRVADNIASGRIYLRNSRRRALLGIEALDRNDREFAEILLRDAEGLRAAALEAQVTQGQFGALFRDAKLRGADGTRNRDRRLAEAVAKQESEGLKGPAARAAALRADRDLEAEFRGKGDAAIRRALRRGRAEKS